MFSAKKKQGEEVDVYIFSLPLHQTDFLRAKSGEMKSGEK